VRFHGSDRGSNPLGDANTTKKGHREVAFFMSCDISGNGCPRRLELVEDSL
jgi:hypothetical protein